MLPARPIPTHARLSRAVAWVVALVLAFAVVPAALQPTKLVPQGELVNVM
jgi:arabinoxylan arabinofuranohydrolase